MGSAEFLARDERSDTWDGLDVLLNPQDRMPFTHCLLIVPGKRWLRFFDFAQSSLALKLSLLT
jgi:hypothetical protein